MKNAMNVDDLQGFRSEFIRIHWGHSLASRWKDYMGTRRHSPRFPSISTLTTSMSLVASSKRRNQGALARKRGERPRVFPRNSRTPSLFRMGYGW